jgi:two-component sensor histidine kinase
LLERLRMIAEMNHHVRNALQVISYSSQTQPNEDLARMVRESSQRIEWALREVLGSSRIVE